MDQFSPHELWAAARALGDEPELEWTFPILLFRALALKPELNGRSTGIDLIYEPLSTWDETVGALRLIEALLSSGEVPIELMYHLSVGIEVFDGAFRCIGGRLPMPKVGERFRGRHYVSLVGLTDAEPLAIETDLVFRNSWGDWGDQGLGYIDRPYFQAHVDSIWVERAAWVGPSFHMDRAMKDRSWSAGAAGSPRWSDFVKAWLTPNRLRARDESIEGRKYQLRNRIALSASEGMPRLEIIDLREPGGEIQGRCQIKQDQHRSQTVIEEIFVRPSARRRGIGRLLMEAALQRARSLRSNSIELLLHEADAGPGRERSIAFGRACGAIWNDITSRRPRVEAVGRIAFS